MPRATTKPKVHERDAQAARSGWAEKKKRAAGQGSTRKRPFHIFMLPKRRFSMGPLGLFLVDRRSYMQWSLHRIV
jgi:hypothetical protein